MSKLFLSKFSSAAITQLQSHIRRLECARISNNALYKFAPKFPVTFSRMNKNELNESLYSFPSYILSTPSSKRFYCSSSSSSSSSNDGSSDDDQLRKLAAKQRLQAGRETFHSKSVPAIPKTAKAALKKKAKSEGQLGDSSDHHEPLTTPACASLSHITPLDEHTIGFDLSRRRRSRPAPAKIAPSIIRPSPIKRKEPKPKPDVDPPIVTPTIPKRKPRKKMKIRLPVLNQNDCFRRHLFAMKLLMIFEDEPDVLDNILWTDECNFNLPKVGPWLISKPPMAESELLPQIAWCGISSKGVIGPYFFNSFVTEKSYLQMLEEYLIPELESKGYNLNELWFQQDGAPWHRTKPVLDFLKSVFDYRVISLGTTFIWPPHSQDLTPMDYFFWDYMKVRLNFKHSKYDLCFQKGFRDILTREVVTSDVDAVQASIYQLPERLALCISMNGERFSHLLYPDVVLETGVTAVAAAVDPVSLYRNPTKILQDEISHVKERAKERIEEGSHSHSQDVRASVLPPPPHPQINPCELLRKKLNDYYAKIPNLPNAPAVTLDKADPAAVVPAVPTTENPKPDNIDGKRNKGA